MKPLHLIEGVTAFSQFQGASKCSERPTGTVPLTSCTGSDKREH